MKRLSWKYLAGLIDGEGCIDMQVAHQQVNGQKEFYCRPRFRMTLSGKAGEIVLGMLSANFGGHFDSVRFRKRFAQNGTWAPAYTWQLTGRAHLRPFLQNLTNHLIIKKEQARFAIWWIDHIKGGNQYGRLVTEEVRRFACEELKAMKKDPQRLSERASAEIQRMMRQSSAEISA
jgi:hypothetical protein